MTALDDPEAALESRPAASRPPGGMGLVFEAEQQVPRRRVAREVIRGGFVDERFVTMLRRERLVRPAVGCPRRRPPWRRCSQPPGLHGTAR